MSFNYQKGIALVELLVVMGIFAVLIVFATVNLSGARDTTVLAISVDTIVTDVKSQQFKAMVGDTDGTGDSDSYGIYFESSRYTLFKGASFVPGAPSNFTIMLESGVEFSSITFLNSSLIFSQSTGEVVGWAQGNNSITVKNSLSGQANVITVNRIGGLKIN